MANAIGKELEVYVSKTLAESEELQKTSPQSLCFSSDEGIIVFNGKKYGTKVDSQLNASSTNPVQNKVLTGLINKLNDKVFPLSISVSGGGVFAKQSTQTITVKWTVKAGDDVITPDSIKVNGAVVEKTTTTKTFADVTDTTIYTVEITYNGKTIRGTTTATFVWPTYYGAVSSTFTPDDSHIKGLTSTIKNIKAYTTTFNLNNQKVCYAYPKSFGALTSIKDANNFEYINSYQRTEVEMSFGETYYVYTLIDATTITSFKQIYA